MAGREVVERLKEWELFHGFSEEEIRQFHASGFGRLSEYKRGVEIRRKSWAAMPVIGGKWYYMNASGVMQTGWQQIGGKWYQFNLDGTWVA